MIQNENISSRYFIDDDSHVKILWLHIVVFSEHDISHFRDDAHLLKHYPVKLFQNYFYSLNCLIQKVMQGSKFSFAQNK